MDAFQNVFREIETSDEDILMEQGNKVAGSSGSLICRGWSIADKKMFMVDTLYFDEDGVEGVHLDKIEKTPFQATWYNLQEVILSRAIGLNDNNGKKIFIGDIIKFDDTQIGGVKGIGEVVENLDPCLDNPGYGVIVVPNKGYAPFPWGCEVIGNIFENPELLKGHRPWNHVKKF